jgi:RNA polymerase sigma-70 factor (ECF subfamily)
MRLVFSGAELYYYCMTKDYFETLFKMYYTKMYHLARTILYDTDESKDVVQEVFTQLLDTKTTLHAETIEAYLLTSVRHRCFSVLEHRKITEQFAQLYLSQTEEPITSSDDMERLDDLIQYIEDNLPPLGQQIFRLRFLQGMSYQEVADAIGVSKVTVYNHLSQTLHKITLYFKS